jgi:hypothetical protein
VYLPFDPFLKVLSSQWKPMVIAVPPTWGLNLAMEHTERILQEDSPVSGGVDGWPSVAALIGHRMNTTVNSFRHGSSTFGPRKSGQHSRGDR